MVKYFHSLFPGQIVDQKQDHGAFVSLLKLDWLEDEYHSAFLLR